MPALGVVPGFGPGPGLTFEVEGQATVDLLVVARRTTGLDRHRFEEQEIASYQVQLHRPGRLPGTHLRSAESGTLNVLALPGRTSIRCRISGRLGGYLVRFDLPTVPSILLSGGDEDTPTDHADPGDRT